MSKTVVAIIIIILVVLGGVGFVLSQRDEEPGSTASNSSQATGAQDNTATEAAPTSSVSIKDMAFASKSITVKKGATVTWTNNDSVAHTVTSDDGNVMDSDSLSKGDTYSVTFNETGTFAYHCTPHPSMKAEVVVTN